MRDSFINKFMDRCIVLHDFYDRHPIVVRIDKIEAIHRDIYNDDDDDDDDNERCIICLHCTTLTVSESMQKVLRILQQRG